MLAIGIYLQPKSTTGFKMRKFVGIVILFILLPCYSYGNMRICGTPEPFLENMKKVRARLEAHSRKPQRTAYVTIPIAFHIVRHDDGFADVTQDQILSQISVLNVAYLPHGFQFNLQSIDRTNNTTWSTHDLRAEQTSQAMKQQLNESPATVMNIYCCDLGDSLLGYAFFPDDYEESSYMHGVVLKYTSLPGGSGAPYNEGDTAVHEVGHFLGLYHTFQNGCQIPGDDVDDTPYELNPARGCPLDQDTCPQQGYDPVDNYMDYADDNCMHKFTHGQAERMQTMMEIYKPLLFNAGTGPKIIVKPISGLSTDENGRTAAFNIVLNTMPVADVVVTVSSSDIGEGVATPLQYIFTTINWNIPAIFTITGIDDHEIDGRIAYTIISRAVSTDPDYNDISINDIRVINLDNESNQLCGNAFYDDGIVHDAGYYTGGHADDPDYMFGVLIEPEDFGFNKDFKISAVCAGNATNYYGRWKSKLFIYSDQAGFPDPTRILGQSEIITGDGAGQSMIRFDPPLHHQGSFWIINQGDPSLEPGSEFNLEFDGSPNGGHSYWSISGMSGLTLEDPHDPNAYGDYILRAELSPFFDLAAAIAALKVMAGFSSDHDILSKADINTDTRIDFMDIILILQQVAE